MPGLANHPWQEERAWGVFDDARPVLRGAKAMPSQTCSFFAEKKNASLQRWQGEHPSEF